MGTKWEVWAYVPTETGYGYEQTWGGRSGVVALIAAVKAKRSGAGCVKIEWR